MDDERPRGAEQERVAVGRALGDALGRHVAAGASHVLGHNRFAPGFGELVADHPRNDVGGTAGHKADQDAERLIGIARLRKRVARRQQRRQRGRDTDGLHRCSLSFRHIRPPRRTQPLRRRQDGNLWTCCYAAKSSMTRTAAEPAAARLSGPSHRVAWPRSSRDEAVLNVQPGAHCTVIPAELITLAHLSVSSAMNFANLADVNGIGSTPRSASRAFDLGSARAAVIALLSLLMISAGVLLGAPRPYQPNAS